MKGPVGVDSRRGRNCGVTVISKISKTEGQPQTDCRFFTEQLLAWAPQSRYLPPSIFELRAGEAEAKLQKIQQREQQHAEEGGEADREGAAA